MSLTRNITEKRRALEVSSGKFIDTIDIIELYGMAEIIRDIERKRDYRAEQENFYTYIMNKITEDQFNILNYYLSEFCGVKTKYDCAEHFRQRYNMAFMS